VETELDLDDHSGRTKVERDLALCELLNEDIGNSFQLSEFHI
jgi:hypothetical protein